METALVVRPVFLRLVEGTIVVGSIELHGVLVVEDAFAVQGIEPPLPLVSDAAVGVVECALPVHLIVLPIPTVLSSFVVVEGTVAVAQTVYLSAFVAALGEGLLDEGRIGEFCFYAGLQFILLFVGFCLGVFRLAHALGPDEV
jgi:hypothetical protein